MLSLYGYFTFCSYFGETQNSFDSLPNNSHQVRYHIFVINEYKLIGIFRGGHFLGGQGDKSLEFFFFFLVILFNLFLENL